MTILLVTNREDYTADFVVLELQRRKLDYLRLNTEDIPSRIGVTWTLGNQDSSYIEHPKKRVYLSEITSIWYRRPVLPIPSSDITDLDAREFIVAEARSAFAGIWRSLNCLWVSHPDYLHAASFKIWQLQLAQKLGFLIPQTVVTTLPTEAERFISTSREDIIFKPVSSTKLRKDREGGFIFTNKLDLKATSNLESVRYSPTLFQALVEKQFDIRVTVIGKAIFAVAIDSQSVPEAVIDWRKGYIADLRHKVIQLPSEVETRCLSLVSAMGLNFGAIDLVLDRNGEYQFLEINPNGQWAWIEQLTGLPLTTTLVDLLAIEEN